MVALCAKLLDPSSVVGQEQLPVLGLSAEDVLKQMPAKQVFFLQLWLELLTFEQQHSFNNVR